MGEWSGENLLLLHHLFRGCRTPSGAMNQVQDQCLALKLKSCVTLDTIMNSCAILMPAPSRDFCKSLKFLLKFHLLLVAATVLGPRVDVSPPFAAIEKLIGSQVLLSGGIEAAPFCGGN